MTLERLYDLGFDRSSKHGRTLHVACSQCAAVVIMDVPTHETGCPNAKHECKGCNNLVPVGVKYCEDCR